MTHNAMQRAEEEWKQAYLITYTPWPAGATWRGQSARGAAQVYDASASMKHLTLTLIAWLSHEYDMQHKLGRKPRTRGGTYEF